MADPVSNGLYGVPWGIGGGVAELQAEVARFLIYLLTNGQDGVMGKDDFAPLEFSTPGAGIRLLPGGLVAVNRTSGILNQSYMGLGTSEVTVNLDPTTTSARTDLVMLRIEDPYVSGNTWTVPTDQQNGPYIKPFVQYNVPSNIQTVTSLGFNWSAVPICKVTRPSSTATILDSNIVDLRTVVNPITGVQPTSNAYGQVWEFSDVVSGNVSPSTLSPTDLTYKDWPLECTWTVIIPDRATYVEVDIEVKCALLDGGDVWGQKRVVMAGVGQTDIPLDENQQAGAPSGGERKEVWFGGEFYIPPSIRGTAVTFKTQAKNFSDARVTGTYYSDTVTLTRAVWKFKQVPGVA